MIEYEIVFFVMMLPAICEALTKFKQHKGLGHVFFYALSFCLLFLLCGLRYETGKDYISYQELFKQSSELFEMKEIGFIYTIIFLNKIGLQFSSLCLIYAFFTVGLTFRFINKYSPYIFLSLIIYYCLGNFFFSSFNVMRQALAVAIFINTFSLIQKGKFIKYLSIIIFTSVFIHATAIILILLYFFLGRTYRMATKIIFILLMLISSSYVILIIENSPYAVYLNFEDFATTVPPTYYLLALIGIYIFIFSIRNPEWEKNNLILLNLNVICIGLFGLIFTFSETPLVMVINRILGYFTIIYVILIPKMIQQLCSQTTRSIIYLCCILVMGILSYMSLIQNGEKNNMVPYKTILY